MSSVKVVIFLLGAMLVIMEFQKASAASLFEDLDDDDTQEDSDDFDLDDFADTSMFKDDLKDDVKEKRAGCANYASRAFCLRARSWCGKSSSRGRLMARKCRSTCGECLG